jgi:hypothetical protein
MGSALSRLSIFSEQVMIRTINEHHRAAKRLFALAGQCQTTRGRLRMLQFARLNLLLAKAKLKTQRSGPIGSIHFCGRIDLG